MCPEKLKKLKSPYSFKKFIPLVRMTNIAKIWSRHLLQDVWAIRKLFGPSLVVTIHTLHYSTSLLTMTAAVVAVVAIHFWTTLKLNTCFNLKCYFSIWHRRNISLDLLIGVHHLPVYARHPTARKPWHIDYQRKCPRLTRRVCKL